MNYSYFADKIKQYRSENGLSKTIFWLLGKLLKRVSHCFYQELDYKLGVFYVNNVTNLTVANDNDVIYRKMTRKDLYNIALKFGDSLASAFSQRLNNSTGYIVFCENQVAGYAWTSCGFLKNEGIKPFLVNLLPHDNTIYIYDCFTLPEYRNKKLFSRLLDYVLLEISHMEFNKAFLIVRKDNSPMLKVIDHHGFIIEGEIKCRKYLFIKSIKNDAFSKVCTVIP